MSSLLRILCVLFGLKILGFLYSNDNDRDDDDYDAVVVADDDDGRQLSAGVDIHYYCTSLQTKFCSALLCAAGTMRT